METVKRLNKAKTIKGTLKILESMTPDEIADYLRDQGIKGVSNIRTCPMALFLRTKTRHRISVTAYVIEVDRPIFNTKVYKTPTSVADFISVFDLDTEYNDLHLEADRKIAIISPIQF